jgi:hypothetical protein
LVFSTNFRLGFDPAHFQPVLPKDLIHHMEPGEEIYRFFTTWKQAAQLTAAYRVWGARSGFVAAAHVLAEMGWPVNLRPGWLRKGYLILYTIDTIAIHQAGGGRGDANCGRGSVPLRPC